MKPIKQYIVDLDSVKDIPLNISYNLSESFFSLFEDTPVSKGNVHTIISIESCGLNEFFIKVKLDGNIKLPCDRCLGEMDQLVSISDTYKVRYGMDIRIGDEFVSMSKDDPEYDFTLDEGVSTFDLSSLIYELLTLSIPIKHVHLEGECDPEMEKVLQEHLAVLPGGNDEEVTEDSNEGDDIDPRWNALKQILNNN